MAALSESDERVLDCIFNPNQVFGREIISEQRQTTQSVVNGHDNENEANKKLKELELIAVEKAEQGDIDAALNCLNAALQSYPNSASLYNNRAQVLLLKGDKDLAALDLDKALELCQSEGIVAAQVFTQRALIKKLNGDNEGALEDFQMGAKLGNAFAKLQVVNMNPYAALCNQMLMQAIGKLREGDLE